MMETEPADIKFSAGNFENLAKMCHLREPEGSLLHNSLQLFFKDQNSSFVTLRQNITLPSSIMKENEAQKNRMNERKDPSFDVNCNLEKKTDPAEWEVLNNGLGVALEDEAMVMPRLTLKTSKMKKDVINNMKTNRSNRKNIDREQRDSKRDEQILYWESRLTNPTDEHEASSSSSECSWKSDQMKSDEESSKENGRATRLADHHTKGKMDMKCPGNDKRGSNKDKVGSPQKKHRRKKSQKQKNSKSITSFDTDDYAPVPVLTKLKRSSLLPAQQNSDMRVLMKLACEQRELFQSTEKRQTVGELIRASSLENSTRSEIAALGKILEKTFPLPASVSSRPVSRASLPPIDRSDIETSTRHESPIVTEKITKMHQFSIPLSGIPAINQLALEDSQSHQLKGVHASLQKSALKNMASNPDSGKSSRERPKSKKLRNLRFKNELVNAKERERPEKDHTARNIQNYKLQSSKQSNR